MLLTSNRDAAVFVRSDDHRVLVLLTSNRDATVFVRSDDHWV